jgi:hypothetical protein
MATFAAHESHEYIALGACQVSLFSIQRKLRRRD